LIKYILEDILRKESSSVIERATILKNGALTERFAYLQEYAAH